MGKGVRKKCTECKKVQSGTSGRYERCPDCGAEMRPIPYMNRRKARATRG